MKILVAAGGLSPERDVSMCSGAQVANALIERGHEVALVDIYKGAEAGGAKGIYVSKDQATRFSFPVPKSEPDIEAIIRENGGRREELDEGFLPLCKSCDIVFVALHGGIGENGTFQALLETFGVKYTGSSSMACALAMDKAIAKTIAAAAGVKTPPFVLLQQEIPLDEAAHLAGERLGFPCVIKPCGCGSSIGVAVACNERQAKAAIEKARAYGTTCMAESFVAGRELTCAVLEEAPDAEGRRIARGLPPVEIIPKSGFYGYEEKYQAGFAREVCPAEVSAEVDESIKSISVAAHKALRLKVYSRSDFILDSDGALWWLEVNTLPGMTPTSLVPQEAAACGISYVELCERIIEASLGQELCKPNADSQLNFP